MRKIFLFLCFTAAFVTGIAQVFPTGLNVNDKAPLFSAVDQTGTVINLRSLLQKGSVVMIFYRGQWCPYCNKQLSQLEDSLQLIQAKGATLLAVTPENQENIQKTIQKTKASYAVIHDSALQIMNAYQVAFEVDENTSKRYLSRGIDFNIANSSNGNYLPVPAVYIINKQGIITYAYFDTNYRVRPSVQTLLEHL